MWLPVIERCLSRTRDSDFSVEEAFKLRLHLKANGLNAAAIALVLLQLEDADPTNMGNKHDIDGYA